MITSIDEEKEKRFDKIQHGFIIKVIEQVGMQGTYSNIIKATYEKHTVNIILNEENIKAVPLKSEMKEKCPFIPTTQQ